MNEFVVKINGVSANFRDDYKEAYKHVLISFAEKNKNSSLDYVKELITGINEMFMDHIKDHSTSLEKKEKSKATRFIAYLKNMIDYFSHLKNHEYAIKCYYNIILRMEDMATLHGFSIKASIDKHGNGKNPETRSIYGVY